MGHIKQFQTWLEIAVKVEHDISNCTCKIMYKKPNGKTGEWVANPINEALGIIIFSTFTDTTLDITGDWIAWSKITNQAGKVAEGDPFIFTVYPNDKLIK